MKFLTQSEMAGKGRPNGLTVLLVICIGFALILL